MKSQKKLPQLMQGQQPTSSDTSQIDQRMPQLSIHNINKYVYSNFFEKRLHAPYAGNTLEDDVSDVIALHQLTSLFSPWKATRMSPKFSAKYGVSLYISIYTRVISWCLTSGEVQHAIRLVYIKKNRYVVEDPSGKAADVFPRKIRGIR